MAFGNHGHSITCRNNGDALTLYRKDGKTFTLANGKKRAWGFLRMVKLFSEIMSRHRPLKCGGTVKVIASIEDPVVIEKILSHLNEKKSVVAPDLLSEDRASPQLSLFDG